MTTTANGQPTGQSQNGGQRKDDFSGQLHLVNQIGLRISIDISNIGDAYEKARLFGRGGWTSIEEIPPGGLHLPYCMADKFDWSLLGAEPGTCKAVRGGVLKDCPGVWFRGMFYYRRDLPANEAKGMPEAIKFSRGAKGTDDEQAAEGDEKSVQFVTLIIFKGKGREIPMLCKPQNKN